MLKKFFKAYSQEKDGVAAVEFVLIAPILLLLLIGTADVGFYIMNGMSLQSTAYGVAEFVAQKQDDSGVDVVARELYRGDFDDVEMTAEFNCECADGVILACPVTCEDADDFERRFISVTLSSDFDPIFPWPGLGSMLQLEGSARLRVD